MTPEYIYIFLIVSISASDVYMLASTVSSKILQTIGRHEGFNFEVNNRV